MRIGWPRQPPAIPLSFDNVSNAVPREHHRVRDHRHLVTGKHAAARRAPQLAPGTIRRRARRMADQCCAQSTGDPQTIAPFALRLVLVGANRKTYATSPPTNAAASSII